MAKTGEIKDTEAGKGNTIVFKLTESLKTEGRLLTYKKVLQRKTKKFKKQCVEEL